MAPDALIVVAPLTAPALMINPFNVFTVVAADKAPVTPSDVPAIEPASVMLPPPSAKLPLVNVAPVIPLSAPLLTTSPFNVLPVVAAVMAPLALIVVAPLTAPVLIFKPLIVPVVFAVIVPLALMVVTPLTAPALETSKFVELIVSALLPPPSVIVPLPVTEKLPLVWLKPVIPLSEPLLILRPLMVPVVFAAIVPEAAMLVTPLNAPAFTFRPLIVPVVFAVIVPLAEMLVAPAIEPVLVIPPLFRLSAPLIKVRPVTPVILPAPIMPPPLLVMPPLVTVRPPPAVMV